MSEVKRRIRVLSVATSMRLVGGQSIQARRLLDAFADDPEVEMRFLPNNPFTPFERIKYLRTVFASLRFWWSLLVSVPRADIVQISSAAMSGYAISTLPPLLFAKLFRRRAILYYHSGELERHIAEWPRTALPTMGRFDAVVVPSRFLAEIFGRHGIEASVGFNFVDTSRFRFRERGAFRPVFLSNRNFEPHYNVGDTLRAFAVIRGTRPDAKLILAGSGSEEPALRELAAELKLDDIEWTGGVPNDEMPRLFDRADFFLNTSVVDNMPLSFIEAFAAGVPVVSYATGGIPFIVEDGRTGALVATGDFEGLARRALSLLDSPETAASFAAAARDEVRKYDFGEVRAEWLAVYNRLSGPQPTR